MPSTAIEKVEVDYVAPLTQIASIIAELAGEERSTSEREDPIERILSTLTYPECRGPIWEERQGTIVEFRCRVGHVYPPHRISIKQFMPPGVVETELPPDK
jgi:two-component system chemotaxis response regulator CheB